MVLGTNFKSNLTSCDDVWTLNNVKIDIICGIVKDSENNFPFAYYAFIIFLFANKYDALGDSGITFGN